MSLLDEAMTPCVLLNKITEADGYGGYVINWVEGAEFNCAIVLDSSLQAKVAEKQGVTGLYTITTKKVMSLQYHDVFKRIFRNSFTSSFSIFSVKAFIMRIKIFIGIK